MLYVILHFTVMVVNSIDCDDVALFYAILHFDSNGLIIDCDMLIKWFLV